MKILKNVFLSVGIFVFTFALFGLVSVGKAEAETKTAATGPWDTAGTWTPAGVPLATDDVVIPSGVVVTAAGTDVAKTVTINNTGATTGITITTSLAVSGAVTLNAPTGDGTTTIAVGAGTLTATSLTITGGTGSKISEVTVGAGTITINPGNAVLSGTAVNARLTSTGTSTIRIYGTLSDGGTILDTGGTTWTVDGTTTISSLGSLTFSATTGTNHTFTGAVTVDIGGEYKETVAVTPVVFTGAINNNGTSTISTGDHTFTGIVTNTGIFNLANTTIPTFAASTSGTINYTGAGQTVQVITYYDLGLSGSGTKVLGAVAIHNLAITGPAIASLVGDSTANKLYFGTLLQRSGTWGSSGSSPIATHINSTYFLAGGTKMVTVATGSSGSSNVVTQQTVYTNTATPPDTTAPSGTSVSINSGVSTSSSLPSTLTFTAIDATEMMISNDSGFAGASWESYDSSVPWTLTSGDGVKTVYAKFKDTAGNMSTAVSDTITVSGSGTVAVPLNEPVQGCSAGNLFNTSTGALCVNNAVPQGCSGGNLFSTSTGAVCTNNAVVLQIPGCGNRATGFSTASGLSCIGNPPAVTPLYGNDSPRASGYAFGNTLVKQGSTGGACLAWQTFLNAHGASLATDGACGKLTMAAARIWQTANGLVADGLLGAKSRAKANTQ